jgi:molybdopterin/thiamine biosynthesis adenylyltransferase
MATYCLYGEELKAFCSSSENRNGIGYEWEGESVIHLRLSPLHHSFGTERSVRFVHGNGPEESSDADFTVSVDPNGKASVWPRGAAAPEEATVIPARDNLYSRSKGLIEVGILESRRVIIVGLGSFGSQIAIELAKSGVGQFSLMDFDRVELHNLVRHTAFLNDLGRLKTDYIRDCILGKNPYAKVDCFPVNINEHLDILNREVEKADLVICATDNNQSRFNISEALVKHSTVGIFGRAITRAEGGDVFRYRPGGPCYVCMIGDQWYQAMADEITDEASARANGQIAAYTSVEDADAMVQVGLSSDIEPMCNMMVKLSLIELSRGTESGISSLDEELVFPAYLWVNRRERHYTGFAPFNRCANRPTIMRWYGLELPRNEHCALCGEKPKLDLGDDFLKGIDPELSRINTDINDDILDELSK